VSSSGQPRPAVARPTRHRASGELEALDTPRPPARGSPRGAARRQAQCSRSRCPCGGSAPRSRPRPVDAVPRPPRTDAKVPRAQPIEVLRRDQRSASRTVRKHNGASDRHRFKRRTPLRKHQVELRQQYFWCRRRIARSGARNGQAHSACIACCPDRAAISIGRRLVAEDERSRRANRQRLPLCELLQVHEVQEHLHLLGSDTFLSNQPVGAHLVDGDITRNRRVAQGLFLPGNPAVAEMDDWHSRKPQRRDERFDVVVAVNDVRCAAQSIEIVDHGDGRCPQLVGHGAQDQAERHGPMPTLQQRQSVGTALS